MASYEEVLFWKEHLPLLKKDSHSTRGYQDVPHHNDRLIPIPASSAPASPLVTLPVEVLCKIFHLSIRHYEDHPDNFALVDPNGPTKLIQICRYWRAVALSDSTLWASIKVSNESPECAQRVRLWMIRTGTLCPLTLYLGYTRNPQTGEAIMELFLAQIHRWRKICFEFFPNAVQNLQLLAQLRHGSAPQLRTILLECMDCPVETMHSAWAALASTPSLRAVHLEYWTPGFTPSVPWHQLTYLSSRTIGISDVLRHCKRLEFYSLSRIRFRFQPQLNYLHCASSLYAPAGTQDHYLIASRHRLFVICQSPTNGVMRMHGGLRLSLNCLLDHDALQFFKLFDFGLDDQEFIEYIQPPMLSTVKSAVLAGRLSDKVIEKLVVTDQRDAVKRIGS